MLGLRKLFQIGKIDALSKEDVEGFLDYEHISNYLLPVAFDKDRNLFVLDDDYIAFGFMIGTKPSVGMETLNFLENGIYQDPQIPENTILQWILWGSDFIQPALQNYLNMKDSNEYNTFRIAQQFADFIEKKSKEEVYPEWSVLVKEAIALLTIKVPFNLAQVKTDADYSKKVASVIQMKKNTLSTLQQGGFNPVEIDSDFYLLFTRLMVNPSHEIEDASYQYNDEIPLKKQVVYRDTKISQNEEESNIKIDKTYGKILTIKQYPKSFTVAETREWVGSTKHLNKNQIYTNFIVNLILRKMTDKEKGMLMAKSETTMKQQSFTALSRKLQERQEDCMLIARETESGQQIWKGLLQYYLYTEDKDRLDNASRVLKNMLQANNVELQEEIVPLPFFMSSLPFNAYKSLTLPTINRAYTMLSYNAAHLTPIQFDWKGSGTPVVPFVTRSGQLSFVDLWDTNGGMNACVVGPMGQGKSVFVNHLVFNYRSSPNTKIRIIDVGRSYIGISRLFDGIFIEPTFDRPVKINPFSHVTKETLNRDMDFLVNIVDTMIKPTEKCTDTERGMIQVAIRSAVMKYGSNTEINHIKAEIDKIAKERNDYEFQKLADFNLSPWCEGGQYAEFMSGRNEVDLNNRLVVFELGALKDDTKLTNIFILTMFYFINTEIYQGDRDEKKLVIWDEAWRFADNKAVLQFIEQGAREYRKFNSSLIFITQGISDLLKNEVTKTLKNNSEYLFLFWQPPEEWERMSKDQDVFLSDYEKEIYRDTIKTVKGKYSELLVISRSTGRGILRLFFPRDIYWIYTTDAKEVAKRDKYYKQTGDILEAVKMCMIEEGTFVEEENDENNKGDK